jgi:hypothetical protein
MSVSVANQAATASETSGDPYAGASTCPLGGQGADVDAVEVDARRATSSARSGFARASSIARPLAAALVELREHVGTQFCPDVVAALEAVVVEEPDALGFEPRPQPAAAAA